MSIENIFIILLFVCAFILIFCSPFKLSGDISEREEKNEAIRKKRT